MVGAVDHYPERLVGGWAILVVVAGLLLFVRLCIPLQEPQEARYAEIPRQMLETQGWLVPVLHGQAYCDKPPLLYWTVMGLYCVLGIHDWVARLVPCVATFLCILVTYFWGKQTLGQRTAMAGAAILCLSGRFIYLGRMLTMDSLLCLWVTLGLATAHVAVSTGHFREGFDSPLLRLGWWVVSAGAAGLGLLTKGPVTLVLILVPVLICHGLDKRTARLHWKAWILYLGVSCILAVPWYVAISRREPAFLSYFFFQHHLVRFLTPFDHQEPGWFYLPGLVLGMLPWTLLLPGLLVFLLSRSPRVAARRPPPLGFFILACFWCFIFFSASGCKRPIYILPVMPPLALALGYFLMEIIFDKRLRRGGSLRCLKVSPSGINALFLTLGFAIAMLAGASGVALIPWRPALIVITLLIGVLVLAKCLSSRLGNRGAWTLLRDRYVRSSFYRSATVLTCVRRTFLTSKQGTLSPGRPGFIVRALAIFSFSSRHNGLLMNANTAT